MSLEETAAFGENIVEHLNRWGCCEGVADGRNVICECGQWFPWLFAAERATVYMLGYTIRDDV
jgi:hypothetical protein